MRVLSVLDTENQARGITRTLLSVTALVAVLVATYLHTLTEWVRDWIRDENYNHGFLIALISGYLVWSQRAGLRTLPRRPSWIGAITLVVSCGLFLLGTAGAEVFTQRMSFLGALGSLVLLLGGWRHLRATAFPIALLVLAIPLPYVLYYGMTAPMQAFAARCALLGLDLVGIPAAIQGNVIYLNQATLEVAHACSGIRSLYSFLAIGALAARFTPAPIWTRVLLFLLAIPLSILGNAIRVWGTGIGVHMFGLGVAEGAVHEVFGIVTIVLGLGFFFLVRFALRQRWSSG